MSTSNIMVIMLISIAVIATIFFFIKEGIKPNSVIGKLLKKDGTCLIKNCSKKLKKTNSYNRYCSFHLQFIKVKKNKNIPNNIKDVINYALEKNSNKLDDNEKRKLLKKINKFLK